MRWLEKSVEAAVVRCMDAYIEKMLVGFLRVADSNSEATKETASLFRVAIDRYSTEIEEMRKFRDKQEADIGRLQKELDAAQAINAELIKTQERLVSQLTKLNINVKS